MVDSADSLNGNKRIFAVSKTALFAREEPSWNSGHRIIVKSGSTATDQTAIM